MADKHRMGHGCGQPAAGDEGKLAEQRVEQDAQEAERCQARQQERQKQGLLLEPEQDRERQSEGHRLGLGR